MKKRATRKVAIYGTGKDTIDNIVRRGFEEFGMPDRLRSARSVFIKPNLVSDTEEHIRAHCNTETVLIEAVLNYLSRYDLKIFMGESESNTPLVGRRVASALEKMGVAALGDKYDFEIVNLTAEPDNRKRVVHFEDPLYLKRLELNNILFNVDFIINLPKIKTHKFSTITCALKNYYGLIPDPFRVKYHNHLHKALADLNSLFMDKTFNVVDGIVAMEGNGPKWGDPVPLGILMFGDDSAAVDTVAARIMQIDPCSIRHLRYFIERYDPIDTDAVRVTGDTGIGEVSRPFRPSRLNLYMKIERYVLPLPWFYRPLYSDFCVRHFLYPLRHLIKRVRGGHCSFYVDE